MWGCRQESHTGEEDGGDRKHQEGPRISKNGGGGVPPCEAGALHICVTQHPIMDTEIINSQQSTANENFENVNFNSKKKVKHKVLV